MMDLCPQIWCSSVHQIPTIRVYNFPTKNGPGKVCYQ